MEISGIFNLTNGENLFIGCSADKYEDDKWSVYSINNEENDFSRKAAIEYCGNVQRTVDSTRSMFLIAMYNKDEKQLVITSDISTSTHNLYYTRADDELFYSTSLKWLLKESGISRKLNAKSVKSFLLNGYVFGNDTLVENVRKLSFSDILNAKKDSLSFSRYDYNLNTYSESEAKELYRDAIADSITESANGRKIHLPLSGGFDSNFILSVLHGLPDRPIHTYTIGSKDGRNEIPAASEIAEQYGDVMNSNRTITKDAIRNLPEIVWRFDGAVYQHGVFLQYELAKLASQNHAECMICGECNNQIQNSLYIDDLRKALTDNQKRIREFKLYSSPFVSASLMILKKSSLMFNSFGIKGLYPYMNKRLVELANSLTESGYDNRLLFKDACAETINNDIFKKIKHLGGSTGINSIADGEILSGLRKKIKKHPALQQVHHDHMRTIRDASVRIYLKTLYKRLRKWVKIDDAFIRELYICLFYNLFITGRFDNNFSEDTIAYSLDDFYSELLNNER